MEIKSFLDDLTSLSFSLIPTDADTQKREESPAPSALFSKAGMRRMAAEAKMTKVQLDLVEETDGREYVTIPSGTERAFRWPYCQVPRITIVNHCTAPITVRLLIDEGVCLCQAYRGNSSWYKLRELSGRDETVTFCDHWFENDPDFEKPFPGNFP